MKQTPRLISQKAVMLLPLCLFVFCSFSGSAQTFTQRIQKKAANEGTLTVTHNSAIDNLVNSAVLVPNTPAAAPAKPKTTATTSTEKSTVDTSKKKDDPRTDDKPVARRDTMVVDSLVADGKKKVMLNSQKVTGFRVQAFAGGNSRADRQKAEQVGNNLKRHYPDVPVYTHFYSPRWICRIGNYRTYEEAHEMLLNVRKLGYTSATIVKGKITVQY